LRNTIEVRRNLKKDNGCQKNETQPFLLTVVPAG